MSFFRRHYIVSGISFLTFGIVVGWLIFVPARTISPLATEEKHRIDLAQVKGASTTINYPPNQYFPTGLNPRFTQDLSISAKAYAAMDRDTGELLLSKDVTAERPIASVAKVMTALVSLSEYTLDTELLIGIEAAHTGEAFMGLSEGEVVRVEDLLYGLMLPSGNDAAEALAAGLRPGESTHASDLVVRRRNAFIEQMNRKAAELGMKDTYFFNPTGLDESLEERTTFSTPLDLLALSNYALSNPVFAKMVATNEHIVSYVPGKHKAFFLYHILQLDRSYPGIAGIKPGNTGFAGETLASYLEKNGRRIILILLDSTRTRDDAIGVYDFLLGK